MPKNLFLLFKGNIASISHYELNKALALEKPLSF
jgi:hypothetical protein